MVSRIITAAAATLLLARGAAAADSDGTTTFPAYYQGMYLGPQSAESMNCGTDDTFVTRSGNAQCCATADDCAIASACDDAVLYYQDDAGSYTCGASFSCVTMTIYQSSPFGGPVASQFFCARNWSANTIYRELPTTTTADSSTATSDAQTSPTSTVPANTGVADPNEDGSSSNPDSDSGSSSQAWIAGPVIGGIAFVGLLGGLAFWFGRRRGFKGTPSGAKGTTPNGGGPTDAEMAMAGGAGIVGAGAGMAAVGAHSYNSTPSNAPPSTYSAGGYYDNKGYYWQNGTPVPSSTSPVSAWNGAGAPMDGGATTYSQGYAPVQQHASELPSTVPMEMSGDSAPGAGMMPELDGTPGAPSQPAFAPYRP